MDDGSDEEQVVAEIKLGTQKQEQLSASVRRIYEAAGRPAGELDVAVAILRAQLKDTERDWHRSLALAKLCVELAEEAAQRNYR
jgi:hypothetical protein